MNKTCPVCKSEFESEHGNQKCCSDKCKIERKKQTDKEKVKGFKRTCLCCGNSFIGNKTVKYCSPECKGETRKKNLPVVKTIECKHCGNAHDTIHYDAEFCSRKCSDKYRYENNRVGVISTCAHCNKEYPSYIRNQKFCSVKCNAADKAKIARDRNGDSFTTGRARIEYKRRQRKARTMVEKVYLNTLIVRDKGCCQLCGDLVDLTVHYNHILAPTNDHIIPLALGGETSYRNCQLAHRGCNSKKSHYVEVV